MKLPLIDLNHKTEDIDLEGPGGNAFVLIGIGAGWIKDAAALGLFNATCNPLPFLAMWQEATRGCGSHDELLIVFDTFFNTNLVDEYDWIQNQRE